MKSLIATFVSHRTFAHYFFPRYLLTVKRYRVTEVQHKCAVTVERLEIRPTNMRSTVCMHCSKCRYTQNHPGQNMHAQSAIILLRCNRTLECWPKCTPTFAPYFA